MRRHRITEKEMHLVMRAVHTQLQRDLENGFNQDTIPLFQLLWRFHEHRTGPPSYPEFTAEELEKLLTRSAEIFQHK